MSGKLIKGILFFGILITGCNSGESNPSGRNLVTNGESATPELVDSIVFSSDNLLIRKISRHVYEHTSYLQTDDFGKVPCNGMAVADGKDAIVFDTPANSIGSKELIRYFTNTLKVTIKAIIPTHFHTDCVGGLKEFHWQGISSYANEHTIRILKEKTDSPVPQNGFRDSLEMSVGRFKVFAGYFGEGHTVDNVIGYFPEENILFGGCLIKESGAGRGNLEDANVFAWPGSVLKIKKRFPQIRMIIPGHGKRGGAELLDYTVELFSSR